LRVFKEDIRNMIRSMLSKITDIEALYDIKDNSIVAISGLK
jgi:hypothetical protein